MEQPGKAVSILVKHGSWKQHRDPVLALLLSLFPGAGQVYNGEVGKAFLFFLTYPWSLVIAPLDAYLSAKRHNEFVEMLETRPALIVENPPSQPPAVVAYRRLSNGTHAQPATTNFYRVGLLAILGSVLAASAATGGLSVPLVFCATIAVVSVSFSLAVARERRMQAERAYFDARSELEAQVISLAAQRRGRLSLAHVVEATKLGLVEAERLMETLALAGQVDLVVEEDGGIIYEFTDLLRLTGETGSSVDRAILACARKSGGRVSLGELALEIEAPVRDIRSCLARMCSDGIARETADGPRTLYVFSDFLRADQGQNLVSS